MSRLLPMPSSDKFPRGTSVPIVSRLSHPGDVENRRVYEKKRWWLSAVRPPLPLCRITCRSRYSIAPAEGLRVRIRSRVVVFQWRHVNLREMDASPKGFTGGAGPVATPRALGQRSGFGPGSSLELSK